MAEAGELLANLVRVEAPAVEAMAAEAMAGLALAELTEHPILEAEAEAVVQMQAQPWVAAADPAS